MPSLAYRLTLYERLAALPEGLTGEILNGQLHTQPRPSGPHCRTSVRLDRTIGRGYDDGADGPGGWWILIEPEVHFVRDQEVAVPDLAGWRRERMPSIPEGHRFEVVPDWVCEILSPSTASKDREIKLPPLRPLRRCLCVADRPATAHPGGLWTGARRTGARWIGDGPLAAVGGGQR